MELPNIITEALNIAKKQKFKVRFYYDDKLFEVKELTYLQLGIILTSNNSEIKTVDIRK